MWQWHSLGNHRRLRKGTDETQQWQDPLEDTCLVDHLCTSKSTRSFIIKRTDDNFELGRILKTLRMFNEPAYLEDRLCMRSWPYSEHIGGVFVLIFMESMYI
jgi:hypothetical protein